MMLLANHPQNVSQGLIALGYWCDWNDNYAMHLPDPRQYIDLTWDAAERAGVVLYIHRARIIHSWRGQSRCRFCGCMNGSACLSDGKYVFPTGFAHYVEKHGVKPPQVFIEHAIDFAKPLGEV